MKKTMAILAATVFVGALSGAAMAQYGPSGQINNAEVQNFNDYLSKHPNVAQQLSANPSLINNKQYLANHQGLEGFLANHPNAAQQLHNDPAQFMRRSESSGGWFRGGHGNYANGAWQNNWHNGAPNNWNNRWQNGGAHPLANTDHYMDEHPDVAQQLQAHPGLVNDPKFVANHPGLQGFLANHPVAATKWQNHPKGYMQHEDRYNQKH